MKIEDSIIQKLKEKTRSQRDKNEPHHTARTARHRQRTWKKGWDAQRDKTLQHRTREEADYIHP